ncbi:phosphoribosylglycinamide formyltransferase 1 [Aliarcobacter faecis]|uniref:phosphoribosylglycinamide formyltransferase n=1 Tax=Aliarcobacter faecis TaxID=1564138 RepID=UPI0004B203AC|nr:phosphoribosylglycinamide formyltransferase [Aliarcobacter faecis]QKF74446.1 phosphoribosylglycinamide formyltransferase 1 [Aliarcobacter faecis]
MIKKIGILASYNGSGFETIQNAIEDGILDAKVCVIITNNSSAGVINKAKKYGIDSFIVNSKLYPDENLDLKITQILKDYECDYIFLSGFMKKIEENLLKAFPKKIINTHPAILPSIYGGAGMYGSFVHQAVVKNGEKKSGVTIHYIDENYDEGETILIKELELNADETAETLETRIKDLEKIAIVKAFKKVLA